MENDSAMFDTPGNNSENPFTPSDISIWNESDVLSLLALPLLILLFLLIVGGVLSNGMLACLFIVCLNHGSTASGLYGVFAVVSFVQSAVAIPLALRSLPGETHENWTEAECKASRGFLIYFVNLYTFLIMMANWCRMRRAMMPCSVHGANLYARGVFLAAIAAIISFPGVAVFSNQTKFQGPHAITIECTISKEVANSMLPRIVVAFNCGIFLVMVVHLMMVQSCIEHRRRKHMSRSSLAHLPSSRHKSLFCWFCPHAKTESGPMLSKADIEECFDWAQITMVVDSPTKSKQEVLDKSWMADAKDYKDGSFTPLSSITDNKPTPSPGPSEEEPSCYTLVNEQSLQSIPDAEGGNREQRGTSKYDVDRVSRTLQRCRWSRRGKTSVVVMAWASLVNLMVSASKPASRPTSGSPQTLAVYAAAPERKISNQKKISTVQTECLISGHQTESQTSGHQTESQTSGHQTVSQTSGHQTVSQTSGHQTVSQTFGYQTESQTSGHQKSTAAVESKAGLRAPGNKNASAKSSKTEQKVKATKDNGKRKVKKVSSEVAGGAKQPKEKKKKVQVMVEKTGKSENVPVWVETTGESENAEGRGGLMVDLPSDETSSMYCSRISKTRSSIQLDGTSSFQALKIGPSIRSRFSAVGMQVTQSLKNTADTILCLSLVFVALCLPYHLFALAEVFAYRPFADYHDIPFVFNTMARYSVLAAPMAFTTLIFGVNKNIAKEMTSRGVFCFRLFCTGRCTRKPASPVCV